MLNRDEGTKGPREDSTTVHCRRDEGMSTLKDRCEIMYWVRGHEDPPCWPTGGGGRVTLC